MRTGWNPTRRNRNIGTKASGYGQNNRLVIPEDWRDSRSYYERLADARATTRWINGQKITFCVEKTRADIVHACTVDDAARLLGLVPVDDLAGIELIVFRQPKRKETILSSVW